MDCLTDNSWREPYYCLAIAILSLIVIGSGGHYFLEYKREKAWDNILYGIPAVIKAVELKTCSDLYTNPENIALMDPTSAFHDVMFKEVYTAIEKAEAYSALTHRERGYLVDLLYHFGLEFNRKCREANTQIKNVS